MTKPRARAKTRQSETTLRFKINAYSPATIPMARLTEYLQELAVLLGEPTSVHFSGLEEGSTVPVVAIEHEAWPKVQQRIQRAEGPGAAPEQRAALRKINMLLRADNADGHLQGPTSRGKLLYFPGVNEVLPKPITIEQPGSIQGTVLRVGGKDQSVPVHLEVEGVELKGCHANRAVAKRLAGHLFETVRLHGTGVWNRSEHGVWALARFEVRDFEVLQQTTLTAAFGDLRAQGLTFREPGEGLAGW